MDAVAVERIDRPSFEDFQRNFALPERPVILRGAIRDWNALKWDFDYLKARVGSVQLPVARADAGVYIDDAVRAPDFSVRPMAFDAFLDSLDSRTVDAGNAYLMQLSIPVYFPELAPDLPLPGYFDPKLLQSFNIWIGPPDTLSWLHYDTHHNLLAAVKGRKKFTLFSPGDLSKLYPYSWKLRSMHFSQVEIGDPDLEKHPRFAEAQPFEGVIEPGDMLFIPVHWWHQLYGLDTTISVNLWWRPPFRHWFKRPQLRLIRRIPRVVSSNLRSRAGRLRRRWKPRPPT